MPESNGVNNVIPFSTNPDKPGPKQKAPPGTEALLNSCRDRFSQAVATEFAGHLTQVYDNLLQLAGGTTSLERQHLCFATKRFLSAHGQDLLIRFRDSYVRIFDTSIAGRDKGSAETRFPDESDLSLVDQTDFERELAIGKLTSRATYNCSHQLTALNRRMAVLRQVPQVGQDDNPLYPKFVFDALLDAAQALDAVEQIQLPLLQQFELHMSAGLPNAYKLINQYLIENGILPKMPSGSELSGDGGYHQAQSTGKGDDPPFGSTDTFDDAVDEADVFTQLAKRLQGTVFPAKPDAYRFPQSSNGASWPTSAIATNRHGNGLSDAIGHSAYAAHENHPASQSGLVGTLTDLQKGRLETGMLRDLDPRGFDPGMVDVLRRIRSAPQVSQSHPTDVLTLDIVSLLFDVIFKDPDFPVTLRAEIGKLQIPILKVALIDKGFFANKLHPARKLLDMIAGAAVGWNEDDLSRLLEEIRDIIETLVTTFDYDIDVFAKQVERFAAFLNAEEQQAVKNTEVVAKEMERRDHKQLAKSAADDEIKHRLHSRKLPDEIVAFMKDNWRVVLIRNFLSGGKDSDQWAGALQTMDDLIWSVAPKRSSEERHRLMSMLPDLLGRLHAGLGSVSLDEDWQTFFSVLIRLHRETLQADCEAESDQDLAPDDSDPPALAEQAAPVDSGLATEVDADESKPSAGEDGDVKPNRYMELAKRLEIGSWVEFRTKHGKQSLRLSWVSGMRGVYLFSNRQGLNALSVAVPRLADHLRRGVARVHTANGLTERAVKSLLQSGALS